MPDTNPAFLGKTARINGSFGTGPNGTQLSNLGNVKYVDSTAAPDRLTSTIQARKT
jgi:hypothetical protein